ncbi:MAG: FGGY family carbohydrate kinase [Nitrososphaeria archaeon]|jgi:xylulokinase
MRNCVLAADFGTSSLKLGLFDDKCRLIHLAPGRYAYRTFSRKPGWVEQDPVEWWLAFKKATKDTFKKSGIGKEEISCINIGAHMGLVSLDRRGNPIRPSPLFFDQRTIKQCEKIKCSMDEKEISEICGNRVSTVQTATQILWLKENEPKIYDRTHKFLITPGYISYLLTDQYSYDWTHSSWSLLFNIKKKCWSKKMFDELKISPDKFPETSISCKLLGEVTARASKETGLKAGTPVMVGGSDTPLAALAEGIVEREKALITAGSVSSIITCTDKPIFSNVLLNRCHIVPDRWLMQGAMNAHSNIFEWLINELYRSPGDEIATKRPNIFEVVEKEIGNSPPGSNGLIFLPFLAGERSPIWDPYARGVIFGLTFHHKRGDIMRSAYEGATYAARHNLETIESMGTTIKELKVVGGGAKSKIWNQIKADILGKRIIVEKAADASLIGSGILACYGAGWFSGFAKTKSVEHAKQIFLPRLEYSKRYAEMFRIYKKLYTRIKSSFRDINRLE